MTNKSNQKKKKFDLFLYIFIWACPRRYYYYIHKLLSLQKFFPSLPHLECIS